MELGATLDRFGQRFENSAVHLAASRTAQSTLAPSPIRRTRASQMGKEQEADWLDTEQMVDLVDLFSVTANADAYLSWNSSPPRKVWVAKRLGIPRPQ